MRDCMIKDFYGSYIKPIFSCVSDIATTVAFWESMTILIVEVQEHRSCLIAVEKRSPGVNSVRQ
ncbi:MAG TPA: hypothetical protein DEW22_07600 [Clostridiales bacterium]|nr:hypothetical protein [Clostridiales bacterium]